MNERTFVYICFIVLGASALLPWNIFITAHKYFFYKLRNVTAHNVTVYNLVNEANGLVGDDNITSLLGDDVTTSHDEWSVVSSAEDRDLTILQLTFENWLTVTCSISGLLGSMLNAVMATRISNMHRMLVGHITVFVSLTAVAVMTRINTDQHQQMFFVVTILLANITNFCSSGFILGACMGLAARFPMEIIQGGQFGQAFVAMCIAITSIVTQATTPSPEWNGLAYFTTGAVFTLVSLLAYIMLVRTEYARTYMHGLIDDDKDDRDNQVEPLISDDDDCNDDDDFSEDAIHDPPSASTSSNRRSAHPTILSVWKKMWYESVNTILLLFVTLSVFPAVCSLVVSHTTDKTWAEYFIPVACFVLFNTGDAVGRFVTFWFRWPRVGSPLLLVLCVVRIVFVFLLFACNTQPRDMFPVLFPHDWQYCIIIFTMALSNGYLLALSNMHASQLVSAQRRMEAHEMELAGSLFGVFCVVGVVLGSAVSFALVRLL